MMHESRNEYTCDLFRLTLAMEWKLGVALELQNYFVYNIFTSGKCGALDILHTRIKSIFFFFGAYVTDLVSTLHFNAIMLSKTTYVVLVLLKFETFSYLLQQGLHSFDRVTISNIFTATNYPD